MNIKGGLTAGFVATVILSILLSAKSMFHIVPAFNPIADIVKIGSDIFGMPMPMTFGWVVHVVVGTFVFGNIYAALSTTLPGPPIVKGIIFGVLTWVLMMVLVMPLAANGLFAISLGWGAVIVSLILQVIYGAVLGVLYPRMSKAPDRASIYPG